MPRSSGNINYHDEKGNVIPGPEPDHSSEDYLAKRIVHELGALLSNRANDVPHRFRAPSAFGDYLAGLIGNQSYYHQVPINTANSSLPMMLQITTRPSQRIMELNFQDCNGWRMFTLEIEYSAIPEKG